MTDTASLAGELRYATDITQADASAASDFLNARIAPQIDRATGDARRTAGALQELARDAYARVTVQLKRLEETDFEERLISRLGELYDLRDAWNRLYLAIKPWDDHPDFNSRWQHVYYADTAAEQRESEVDMTVRAKLAARQAGTENGDRISGSTT